MYSVISADHVLNFVEGDLGKKPQTAVKKALCVMLYSLGNGSFSMLGKILGHSPSIIYRWVVEAMGKTQEPVVSSDIMEMEFDEMWHFIGSKKNKLWIIKAVDRSTRRTVAWVTGNHDTATFQKLYKK
ncbi:IS1 family transposase [Candidatus Lariskella endosymbiont of Hedychridium roseum]|uniref:IS1 family transposase n=1 Tax=Candidatus Lariskella endosymbiont of Hedychridium roseum TaxID=3077949 RepID=UPI0030CD7141